MDIEEQVNQFISRLADLRQTVLDHRNELVALDARIEDIIWPCQVHEDIDAVVFETRNTCLVADAMASKLLLSRSVLEDIVTLMPLRLQRAAAEWFFLHQLVHVAQGLGYQDFRTLNRVGNRHETMRPDCDADFISLKTHAWLLSHDKATDAASAVSHDMAYTEAFSYLLDEVVTHMMQIDPNIFIPRAREVEIKRMFALLVLRYYFTQAGDKHPVPDASIFPWWSEDRSRLYVFVGQVQTLGRGVIHVEPDDLDAVLALLHDGKVGDAYEQMTRFEWPRLSSATLPSRLLYERAPLSPAEASAR